jgi:uncharacterized damage-inducible protein DinB
MTAKDLQRLYNYSYWANRKLLPFISQLTPEQYTQPFAGSHGSIRNTMVHVLSAEWGWLERSGGLARGPALKPDDYPTMESLLETWSKVETYVREFLSKLKDEDLARKVEFTTPRGEKLSLAIGEALHHAANHGVHHRGQVSLLLRMHGYDPDNFDILFYDSEKRAVPAS